MYGHRYVPRVGAYLPRVHGYLPRVGADCAQVAMVAPGVLQAIPGNYSVVQQGIQDAQVRMAADAYASASEIPTPKTRGALFLPASLASVNVGEFSFNVIPACDFEAHEFTIGTNAQNFEISELTIGMKPIFAGAGVIPGPQFAPNSLASRACRGLVRAGTPIRIAGNCLVASDFRGVFSGLGLIEG